MFPRYGRIRSLRCPLWKYLYGTRSAYKNPFVSSGVLSSRKQRRCIDNGRWKKVTRKSRGNFRRLRFLRFYRTEGSFPRVKDARAHRGKSRKRFSQDFEYGCDVTAARGRFSVCLSVRPRFLTKCIHAYALDDPPGPPFSRRTRHRERLVFDSGTSRSRSYSRRVVSSSPRLASRRVTKHAFYLHETDDPVNFCAREATTRPR